MASLSLYQLAFFTPGISPASASFRKQMRQIPNFRYTARGRPQSRHRRFTRVENFGVFNALANFDLLAIDLGSLIYSIRRTFLYSSRSA
jgi:hypothetical protein